MAHMSPTCQIPCLARRIGLLSANWLCLRTLASFLSFPFSLCPHFHVVLGPPRPCSCVRGVVWAGVLIEFLWQKCRRTLPTALGLLFPRLSFGFTSLKPCIMSFPFHSLCAQVLSLPVWRLQLSLQSPLQLPLLTWDPQDGFLANIFFPAILNLTDLSVTHCLNGLWFLISRLCLHDPSYILQWLLRLPDHYTVLSFSLYSGTM